MVAEASCPKCGTSRDEARQHCVKCGLAYDKMTAFAAARGDVPEALSVAWDRAVEHWDDPLRHDELMRLAGQHDAYPWVAARYREKPDDIGKRGLERVRRAAEITLMSSAAARAAKTPEPYRATMAMLGILVILIIAGLVYVVARGHSPSPASRMRPPTQIK